MAEEEIVLTITVAEYKPDPRVQPDGSVLVATLAPGTRISDFLPDYGGWVVRQPGKEPEMLTYNGLRPLPATVNTVTGNVTIRAGAAPTVRDSASVPRTETD